MSRLLFWLVLILVVLYAIRIKLKGERPAPAMREREPQQPARRGEVEDMACCAHCGVFFPASEQIEAGGKLYCSQAHARLSGS